MGVYLCLTPGSFMVARSVLDAVVAHSGDTVGGFVGSAEFTSNGAKQEITAPLTM